MPNYCAGSNWTIPEKTSAKTGNNHAGHCKLFDHPTPSCCLVWLCSNWYAALLNAVSRSEMMLARLKKKWVPRICSCIPIDLWHRLTSVNLLVPHWHVVSDKHLPHISGLYQFRTVQQFKADLEFFLRSYTPVSLEDVISHLDGLRELPKRCFLPTFDDGFREIYDVIAPILFEKGIPAVFFLTTAAIDNHELCYPQKKSLLLDALGPQVNSVKEQEAARILTGAEISGAVVSKRIRKIFYRQRHLLDELAHVFGCDFSAYVRSVQPYLSTQQVIDLMAKGFAIGAHSVDHPLYPELTLDEQLLQTQQSLSWLSDHFKYRCEAFAFPYMDLGISREFFSKIFVNKTLKVTFGMSGVRHHFFAKNVSRFTMENSVLPAEQIVADAFGRALLIPLNENDWVATPA